MKCEDGCSFIVVASFLIISPFIWDVVVPEKYGVLIDNNGNIESYSKRVFATFFEETFYNRQRNIVLKDIEYWNEAQIITREDISWERRMLEGELFSVDELLSDRDYREPTPSEVITEISNEQIADIIRNEHNELKNERLRELSDILIHINNKYSHVKPTNKEVE